MAKPSRIFVSLFTLGSGALLWPILALQERRQELLQEECRAVLGALRSDLVAREQRSQSAQQDLERRAYRLGEFVNTLEAREREARLLACNELGARTRFLEARLALIEDDLRQIPERNVDRDLRLQDLRTALTRHEHQLQAALAQTPEDDRLRALVPLAVRINARSEVGSGVVVWNARRAPERPLETYILTAFHVVKDNFPSRERAEEPVEVDLFEDGRKSRTVLARIAVVETGFDLALLRVEGEIVAPAARLASHARLAERRILDAVLAVGCPLGYAPMPTRGQVSATAKDFDGRSFWMINAPTIFGNSGGAVFDSQSGDLLGILVRIAAYKNVIDIAVPHLGIVAPTSAVEDWLKTTPFAFIAEARGPDQPRGGGATLEAGRPR